MKLLPLLFLCLLISACESGAISSVEESSIEKVPDSFQAEEELYGKTTVYGFKAVRVVELGDPISDVDWTGSASITITGTVSSLPVPFGCGSYSGQNLPGSETQVLLDVSGGSRQVLKDFALYAQVSPPRGSRLDILSDPYFYCCTNIVGNRIDCNDAGATSKIRHFYTELEIPSAMVENSRFFRRVPKGMLPHDSDLSGTESRLITMERLYLSTYDAVLIPGGNGQSTDVKISVGQVPGYGDANFIELGKGSQFVDWISDVLHHCEGDTGQPVACGDVSASVSVWETTGTAYLH